MPIPNHSSKKRPGKRQWFLRRNLKRSHQRGQDANSIDPMRADEKKRHAILRRSMTRLTEKTTIHTNPTNA